jgi:hypothetical protein
VCFGKVINNFLEVTQRAKQAMQENQWFPGAFLNVSESVFFLQLIIHTLLVTALLCECKSNATNGSSARCPIAANLPRTSCTINQQPIGEFLPTSTKKLAIPLLPSVKSRAKPPICWIYDQNPPTFYHHSVTHCFIANIQHIKYRIHPHNHHEKNLHFSTKRLKTTRCGKKW